MKKTTMAERLVIEPQTTGYQLHYRHQNGSLYQGDGIAWLKSFPDHTIDLIFADPPYNIKKAEWDTFESQEAYIEWSMQWIQESARILKPSGSMFICGFSEVLADIKHPASKHFQGCRWLV